MVDRIDRPEAHSPYQITKAKDAKEDQHQSPNQREEQERKYQKALGEKEWGKFDRRTTTIKPLRVSREQIQKCLFRGANMHSGAGILSVDVVWKHGGTTPNALILISRIEDYFHLKKLTPGQDVPEEFWAKGPLVELGIIQVLTQGTSFPEKQKESESKDLPAKKKKNIFWKLGLVDSQMNISWGTIVLYLFFIIITAIVVISVR